MSTICLEVEAFAGTTIDDACRDLCALSDRVGILCEVQFNGVKVWAYPGTDPEQLVKAWQEQMKRPANAYKIASARPVGVPERQDAAWWALVMGAAASIEDAANCLRDPAAKKQAEGAAKHYREAAQKLWDTPGVPTPGLTQQLTIPVDWMCASQAEHQGDCTKWCGQARCLRAPAGVKGDGNAR